MLGLLHWFQEKCPARSAGKILEICVASVKFSNLATAGPFLQPKIVINKLTVYPPPAAVDLEGSDKATVYSVVCTR